MSYKHPRDPADDAVALVPESKDEAPPAKKPRLPVAFQYPLWTSPESIAVKLLQRDLSCFPALVQQIRDADYDLGHRASQCLLFVLSQDSHCLAARLAECLAVLDRFPIDQLRAGLPPPPALPSSRSLLQWTVDFCDPAVDIEQQLPIHHTYANSNFNAPVHLRRHMILHTLRWHTILHTLRWREDRWSAEQQWRMLRHLAQSDCFNRSNASSPRHKQLTLDFLAGLSLPSVEYVAHDLMQEPRLNDVQLYSLLYIAHRVAPGDRLYQVAYMMAAENTIAEWATDHLSNAPGTSFAQDPLCPGPGEVPSLAFLATVAHLKDLLQEDVPGSAGAPPKSDSVVALIQQLHTACLFDDGIVDRFVSVLQQRMYARAVGRGQKARPAYMVYHDPLYYAPLLLSQQDAKHVLLTAYPDLLLQTPEWWRLFGPAQQARLLRSKLLNQPGMQLPEGTHPAILAVAKRAKRSHASFARCQSIVADRSVLWEQRAIRTAVRLCRMKVPRGVKYSLAAALREPVHVKKNRELMERIFEEHVAKLPAVSEEETIKGVSMQSSAITGPADMLLLSLCVMEQMPASTQQVADVGL